MTKKTTMALLTESMGLLLDTSLRTESTVTKSAGVNVLTTSVVIAPANSLRKGMIIFNNSANSAYVSLAATCVAATCTRLIATYTSWECFWTTYYTGPISAIRNSGTGVMTVWEFT